ncbi:MAG: class I SAM-dependent methyltransferase, partial [Phycicoccus sp.]
MNPEARHPHAFSFGAAATAYAEHRPDYAQDAVRWALEDAPGARVLDLGAGTGKLTATLSRMDVDVVAVEPDRRCSARCVAPCRPFGPFRAGPRRSHCRRDGSTP